MHQSIRFLDSMFMQTSKRINLARTNTIRRTRIIGDITARTNRKDSVPRTSMENFAIIGSDLIWGGKGGRVGRTLRSLEYTYKHKTNKNRNLMSVKARALTSMARQQQGRGDFSNLILLESSQTLFT